MKQIIRNSFFGVAPGPAAAPTAPTAPTGRVGAKGKYPNIYYEMTPFESQGVTPYDDLEDTFDLLSDDFYASPWLSAGDQTALTAAWDMSEHPTYGSILMKTISSGTQGFFYKGDGIYHPQQNDLGNITNTVDWSDKYDAMRGFYWLYWTDGGSSAGIIFGGGNRPTIGSSNHGGWSIEHQRSFSHALTIAFGNGEGATGREYCGNPQATNSDTCCVQFEFVKGSHVKAELYYIQNGVLNFDNCYDPPDWDFDTPANVAIADLSGPYYNLIVPINPGIFAQLGAAGTPGRFGKWAFEVRPIGGKWKYLK